MIYCVIPEELAPELYDRLARYYEADGNVEVIIDRRRGERRERRGPALARGPRPRTQRDRRRPRVPGEFPPLETAAEV